jgi:glycosyltransferase involved in cell wall biosynthesis
MNTESVEDIGGRFNHFKFIILVASRLAKEKRIDIAIRVLKKIVEKYPKTGLIIAGDGDQDRYLHGLVKKLNLQNHVVFVGWQTDLVPYYKVADVFLLTSEYEGYGMSLIEAGASGCPIVTTKVGIANTALFRDGENSFVCATGDEKCILESLLKMIRDNSKRELFKRELQVSIKNAVITKNEYVDRYVNLLENLIKKNT